MQEKYIKNLKNLLFDLDLYGVNFEVQDSITINADNNPDSSKSQDLTKKNDSEAIPIKPLKPNQADLAFSDAEKAVENASNLADLKNCLAGFSKCPLSLGAKPIFAKMSESLESPKVLIFLDMPSMEDDLIGEIVCSDDGVMLANMMKFIGLDFNKNCVVMPTLFWRTPGGRSPLDSELNYSRPFWQKAIQIIQPNLILTFGQEAVSRILNRKESIQKIHGQKLEFSEGEFNCPVFPIFSLEYLIENPAEKKVALEDLKIVKEFLG